MREGTKFFAPLRDIIAAIRVSALRMAKNSKTPIEFFLTMDMWEFCRWTSEINSEIDAENKAIKEATKKK